MPRYDLHQHLLPEELVSALSRRRTPPCVRPGGRLETPEGEFPLELAAHDPAARIALLDRDEIDVAVVSLAPTLGVESLPEEEAAPLRDAYHDGIRELVDSSGGRLAAFAAGEVREGYAGASVPASALVVDFDRVSPLLAALEQAGGALFVHPGPGGPGARRPPWWAAVVDYTAEMQAAYAAWLARGAAHPALRVVFAILAGGAPFQVERLASRGVDAESAVGENVFLDTSSYGRRALELCVATFGVRALVYGSDAPVVDSRPTLRAVRDFGEAVADAVCSENPNFLLGASH